MKVERSHPLTDGAPVRACHEIHLSGRQADAPLGLAMPDGPARGHG